MPVIVNRTRRIFRAPISCRTVIAGAPPNSGTIASTTFCGIPSAEFVEEMTLGMAGFAERWLVGPDPDLLKSLVPYLGSYL